MLVLSNSIDFRDISVTAYRDDSLNYKFYVFPDAPRYSGPQKLDR